MINFAERLRRKDEAERALAEEIYDALMILGLGMVGGLVVVIGWLAMG